MQYRVCVEKQVLEVTIMGCTLLPKWGGGEVEILEKDLIGRVKTF